MVDLAIRAEGLGKQFRIGEKQEKYKTFRDAILETAHKPFKKLASALGKSKGEHSRGSSIWALKDVSFEVKQGEIVGVIGRNGAGKSTLLKILSRITDPTKGFAEIHGRVASLLEVGTGFHPELTGRENIFLNGAILGMRRFEINKKFDEIVDFAEVEKFIDTPVKFYSSGMYLRLAFAVAAHLEPEILIMDEVLAVGDAKFQRKCLDKMQDVGKGGRSVIFVSHNMPAITRLCERTILLDAGTVLNDGPSHNVVASYLNSGLGTTAVREWPDLTTAPGNEIVRLRAVRVRSQDGQISEAVDIRKPVNIEMEYEVLTDGHVLVPNFHFYNEEGACVFVSADLEPRWRRFPRSAGYYKSTARIPGNLLSEGTLLVEAAISTMNPVTVHCDEREAVAFQVIDTTDGGSARDDYGGHIPGAVRPMLDWRTDVINLAIPLEEVTTAEGVK